MTSPAETSVRFAFGDNWARFLENVNEDRVREAERSLTEFLGEGSLAGRRFLDVGCGSGLFSLAARRLGADVVSFDFDERSVWCANELRRRFDGGDTRWRVERGSALDREYLRRLGTFDIVYSWGVLHHTGDMWTALDLVSATVAPGGRLMIALYNDQGLRSVLWRYVKHTYNVLPAFLRLPYLAAFGCAFEVGACVVSLAKLQPGRLLTRWTRYESVRGMSRWHDIVDWVGGYPFEVATTAAVVEFYRTRGFNLERLRTVGGKMGCNEFLFARRG